MAKEKDPDILVPLTSARAEFEAQVIVQALEARGIPATVFAIAGQALQWEVAMSDPIRVMVRRRDFAAAQAALHEMRARSRDRCAKCEYDLTGLSPEVVCPECGHPRPPWVAEAQVDWNEVDVGEPEPDAAPRAPRTNVGRSLGLSILFLMAIAWVLFAIQTLWMAWFD